MIILAYLIRADTSSNLSLTDEEAALLCIGKQSSIEYLIIKE